jgi:hypothetical protein
MPKSTPQAKLASNRKLLNKSVRIREVENGYVVSVDGETAKGHYYDKQYIASTEKEAKDLAGKML